MKSSRKERRSGTSKAPERSSKSKQSDNEENWRRGDKAKGSKKKAVEVEEDDGDSSESEVELPEASKKRGVRIAEEVEVIDDGPPTELPFRTVQPVKVDDLRSGKSLRDLAQKVIKPAGEEKAYRVRAPIQRDNSAGEVLRSIHDTLIPVRLEDLFSISRELRELQKTSVTKVRQPVKKGGPVKQAFMTDESAEVDESDLELEEDAISMDQLPAVQGVFVASMASKDVPAGAVVVSDPYLQYLGSLSPGEAPRQVYVAKDSAPLRVVYPDVNSQGPVESVVDSGSQIVSMSVEQAKLSRLVWDPNLQIYMQSANGSLEKSAGVAKNVPFKFGDITLYLQVHIIGSPAYKVLLGRPFDSLTESEVKNKRDGSQIITLTDPNSGKQCSVPTYNRDQSSPEAPVQSSIQKESQTVGASAIRNTANGLGQAASEQPEVFRRSSMN